MGQDKERRMKLKGFLKEEVFAAIANTTPSAIIICREKFIYVNAAVERVTGYSAKELKKMYVWDVVHPQMKELVKERFRDRMAGKAIAPRYEIKILNKKGKEVWIDLTTRIVQYENKPAILGTALDISNTKFTEEALKESLAKLTRILEEIVSTLSSVIELRDPYTAGHQRRVSRLASAMAMEMDLSEDQIEGIRIAGLLHDVGKVATPTEILNKPGPLSEIEFSIIKTHPQVGYEILEKIEFPWPIAQIVLQHHEKLDGSGYPNGLKGKDILLEAKVLAVADVVEAMASHRPYRASLGIEKAIKDIENARGKLYEPSVVDACVKLIKKKKFSLD